MRGRVAAFAIGRSAGKNAAVPQQQAPSAQDTQLEKLVSMHDKGQLTDEEFTQAKKKLLSGN